MIYLEMKRRLFGSCWFSQVHNNCFGYHKCMSRIQTKMCKKLTKIGSPPSFWKNPWSAPVISCYTRNNCMTQGGRHATGQKCCRGVGFAPQPRWPHKQWKGLFLACVASVSNRVIARKLERKPKKGWRGRGRGEEETLARKPHDSGKRPLIFHGSVHL